MFELIFRLTANTLSGIALLRVFKEEKWSKRFVFLTNKMVGVDI
jgi:hypothetical protein